MFPVIRCPPFGVGVLGWGSGACVRGAGITVCPDFLRCFAGGRGLGWLCGWSLLGLSISGIFLRFPKFLRKIVNRYLATHKAYITFHFLLIII